MIRYKTQQEALEAIQSTVREIEALTKSFEPKEDDQPEEEAPAEEAPAEEGAPEEAPAEEAPAEEGSPMEDEAAPEEAPAEDDGEGEDRMAQMTAEAASLSDEELGMMLHVLMEEKDQRMASADTATPGDESAEEEAPMAPAEKSDDDLAMSMKEEFKALKKSFSAEVDALKKSFKSTVDTLKIENDKLKKAAAKVVTKPAPFNSKNVEVLEKSTKEPERLAKSEVTNFLLNEQRKGNKSVNSGHVALVNACKTDDDLAYACEQLKEKGIEIPKKK